MEEYITIFHADKAINKTPLSPYGDKTFVFETKKAVSNLQMFSTMVSHFILNIPLEKLENPVRTYRRKKNLDALYGDCIYYFILDIDKVKSEEDKQFILNYFKDYKVILGESSSYNGINNFNMKGILFTECIELKDAKLALSAIHHDLLNVCNIDESVTRKASLNAPIKKKNIFINNEGGKRYKFVKEEVQEHINEIKSEYVGVGVKIDISDIENIKADTMEKLCLKCFQTMGFIATKNNDNGSITFKHPSEKKSPGGYFWFSTSPYTMHHANSVKSINIFDHVRKLQSAKDLMKKDINYDNEFLNFNTETEIVQVNERYLKVTEEVENAVQKFLDHKDGLFSIRSPMGTGKSTIIQHIIEEAHEQDIRVLIITNRISVAHDFGKKYGMKVYNLDKYEQDDSLICQFDSLWKYKMEDFDLVIMDEFISLMGHSRSNLSNSSSNVAKFFAAFDKKLVIADAFLTGYENFLLNSKETNVHLIDNIYRDPTILYAYENEHFFVQELLYHTKKHKITVSATSLSFIHSLQMLLAKRGLKVITLTAQTPDSTKELIYKLFEKDDHDKWDVLIYSPTLTVGVSNLNNVPYHFHYDSSMSTDVISSIQMIKRTRKSKEIHMFIKDKIKYLKTSYNDIRDEYMGNIGRNAESNYLFEHDKYGESRLSEIGKKAIKIDTFKNILEFNHKEGMFWMLKYHFMKEPRIRKEKVSFDVLHTYKRKIRDDKQVLLENNVEQFLQLNDIDKTALLMDTDADKTMKILAEMDDEIKDTASPAIKAKILEITLKDKKFIQKCKYYKVVFNYTKKIWDETDVKHLVSKSIISNKNNDLHFFNVLLKYGQKEIFDDYNLRNINKNKQLKYILDKCGYGVERISGGIVHTIGYRGYKIDRNVKEYYGFIR